MHFHAIGNFIKVGAVTYTDKEAVVETCLGSDIPTNLETLPIPFVAGK